MSARPAPLRQIVAALALAAALVACASRAVPTSQGLYDAPASAPTLATGGASALRVIVPNGYFRAKSLGVELVLGKRVIRKGAANCAPAQCNVVVRAPHGRYRVLVQAFTGRVMLGTPLGTSIAGALRIVDLKTPYVQRTVKLVKNDFRVQMIVSSLGGTTKVGKTLYVRDALNERGPKWTDATLPLEITLPQLNPDGFTNAGGTTVDAVLIASPNPSSSPAVVPSVGALPLTAVSTPNPIPSVVALASFKATYSCFQPPYGLCPDGLGLSTPTPGTFSLTATGSVNATTTVPVYMVAETGVGCNLQGPDPNDWHEDPFVEAWLTTGGIAFIDGTAVPETTQSASDMYLEGQQCSTSGYGFPGPEAETTLVAPYGMTIVSEVNSPFAVVQASQWVNSESSIALSAIGTLITAGGEPLLLLKTADGHIVKFAMNGNGDDFTGSFAESGYAQDGF